MGDVFRWVKAQGAQHLIRSSGSAFPSHQPHTQHRYPFARIVLDLQRLDQRSKVVAFACALTGELGRLQQGRNSITQFIANCIRSEWDLIFASLDPFLELGLAGRQGSNAFNLQSGRDRIMERSMKRFGRDRFFQMQIEQITLTGAAQRQRQPDIDSRPRIVALGVCEWQSCPSEGALPSPVQVQMTDEAQAGGLGEGYAISSWNWNASDLRLRLGERTSGHSQASPGCSRRSSAYFGRIPHAKHRSRQSTRVRPSKLQR